MHEVVESLKGLYWRCPTCEQMWLSQIAKADLEAQRCIPSLEFLPPDCPLCAGFTEFDDGSFFCRSCDVQWLRSGPYDDNSFVAGVRFGAPAEGAGAVEVSP